ncbi:MAG: nitric oxide reductase NorD protein [Actinomycetota bacterium]|nr:nitric oxide reductase NorD protein [Actinomycetota bacterium]
MTTDDAGRAPSVVAAVVDPSRFRLMASVLADRPLGVAVTAGGVPAHTDGLHVFVSDGAPLDEQRRQVLLQAALLGGGSLAPDVVKVLRGRPKLARRYLALEGRRVLNVLAERIPLAGALRYAGDPSTHSPDESLAVAQSRRIVEDPPAWFGQIRPARLLGASTGEIGAHPTSKDTRLEFRLTDVPDNDDDDDEEQTEESRILKLFQNPLSNSNAVAAFLSKMLGLSPSPGGSGSGGDLTVAATRRAETVGPNAQPLPLPLRFTTDDALGRASGLDGAVYPEWDVHSHRYRPKWCRVFDVPLGSAPEIHDAGVERDDVLRRRLARLGLGPLVQRRRPDGDDVDVDALIDLAVDVAAGHSSTENIYLERRKLARNLGVLILLDASGSAAEPDPDGLTVHEHQRRAAATLAVTLEELGDRVAVYAFRSWGRAAVHLLAIKPFGTRFGAGGRSQLNQLEPAGYTRLGAAIRHAGEWLKTQAGTPNRLLLVLSDGFPYDDGYEARYAEADAHRALEEVRTAGVACLCLSIGASTPTDALHRVFGSASHANAATLSELSPRMDELFLSALKELAAPNSQARRARLS